MGMAPTLTVKVLEHLAIAAETSPLTSPAPVIVAHSVAGARLSSPSALDSDSVGEVPRTEPRVTRRRLFTVDMRAELDAWEARYGVPSDRLADAFRDSTGSLAETDDFHAWSQTYNGWLRVVGR